MSLDHATLLALVPKVNGAIALVSCPFALYEALSKKADVADLKIRIDLCADRLLSQTVASVEETLMPFWPRSVTRIIIEPQVQIESTAALSEAARDALTSCLRKNSSDYLGAIKLRQIPKKIHRFDRFLYWTIFSAASFSVIALANWCVSNDMADVRAKISIFVPGILLVLSLGIAGARQSYIQFAEGRIIE